MPPKTASGHEAGQLKCVAYVARYNRACGAVAKKHYIAETLLKKNARNFRESAGRELYGQVVGPADIGHYLCSQCAGYCNRGRKSKVTVPPDTLEHQVSKDTDVVLQWAATKNAHHETRPFSLWEWYYTPDEFSKVYCDPNISLVCPPRPSNADQYTCMNASTPQQVLR
jgi:hypothetical protein